MIPFVCCFVVVMSLGLVMQADLDGEVYCASYDEPVYVFESKKMGNIGVIICL